jgi:class 3 adenylate cyclase
VDISAWLRELGLERYEEAFRKNDIDAEVLVELGDYDLEKLGIASLRHRKKLLRSIAALSDAQASPALETAPTPPSPARPAEAERRQLTVMFCDLVSSTQLSGQLDPEDLREVLRAYQEICAEVSGRFDGHIAKYIGDGLLVYFGYPQAHEDDARRAVSAGLEIVEGLGALNRRLVQSHRVELGGRVGIHTGLVVVGEMGGGETKEAGAIVGETPNIAARLERLAVPNTVVMSDATHRLVEGLFDCDDHGPQALKGVDEAVGVFRVLGASDAPCASRRRPDAVSHRWWVVARSSTFCCPVGPTPRRAKPRPSCCRVKPASASRASSGRCANSSRMRITAAFSTMAPPITRTAPSIR